MIDNPSTVTFAAVIVSPVTGFAAETKFRPSMSMSGWFAVPTISYAFWEVPSMVSADVIAGRGLLRIKLYAGVEPSLIKV